MRILPLAFWNDYVWQFVHCSGAAGSNNLTEYLNKENPTGSDSELCPGSVKTHCRGAIVYRHVKMMRVIYVLPAPPIRYIRSEQRAVLTDSDPMALSNPYQSPCQSRSIGRHQVFGLWEDHTWNAA
jgi:hypothetical protein